MSNSEPSATVLQGIPCMYGLYRFRFEWRKRFAQGPRFTLSKSRMRSRTGLASPVENQACGIAEYPGLRVYRHEARMTRLLVTPGERGLERCSMSSGRGGTGEGIVGRYSRRYCNQHITGGEVVLCRGFPGEPVVEDAEGIYRFGRCRERRE